MVDEKKDPWHSTGFDGMEEEEERRAAAQVRRFWLPPDAEGEITFVDDMENAPFNMWEHNLKINGNWRNWYTCINKSQPGEVDCPICDDGNRPYYVGFFTVIDHREWTDKKGNKHVNEVKLFPAKLNVLKKLKRQLEKQGTLTGKRFTVFRADRKTPATGDDFEFVGDTDIATEYPEAVAFDYAEILAPKKARFLQRVVGQIEGDDDTIAATGGSAGKEDDDEVHF